MGLRRKARELAIQTLYALDYSETENEFREFNQLNAYPEILSQMAEHEHIAENHGSLLFAEELIKNTIIHLEDIEAMLQKHSDNWSLERIAHLDRSILRVAIYEIMFTDTPAPIVINEAIEVAKKYSSESSNKFVNGILDAVFQDIKFKALSEKNGIN
ncbi:MAG: transcription antitermination factor NusB [Candidatus Cloacimonadaceae bacterium]